MRYIRSVLESLSAIGWTSWKELLDAGYIGGFTVHATKTGRYLSSDWLDSVKITMSGIAYLQDNSKMKQMYELAKEVRDWIPGM